jgi:4-methylaminobutanoate oxidase (formaldehyde-forming)
VLDDARAMVLGNEPVFGGGKVVARVTSGGIGYSVDRSIAFAYMDDDAVDQSLAVEVFGKRVGASVHEGPLWDPKGARIRPN